LADKVKIKQKLDDFKKFDKLTSGGSLQQQYLEATTKGHKFFKKLSHFPGLFRLEFTNTIFNSSSYDKIRYVLLL
jgi:hypothetical protein